MYTYSLHNFNISVKVYLSCSNCNFKFLKNFQEKLLTFNSWSYDNRADLVINENLGNVFSSI